MWPMAKTVEKSKWPNFGCGHSLSHLAKNSQVLIEKNRWREAMRKRLFSKITTQSPVPNWKTNRRGENGKQFGAAPVSKTLWRAHCQNLTVQSNAPILTESPCRH